VALIADEVGYGWLFPYWE